MSPKQSFKALPMVLLVGLAFLLGFRLDDSAILIDGEADTCCEDLARHLSDKAGACDKAEADVVGVWAYWDGQSLYVRIDVADGLPDPSGVEYTIGVTALNYTPSGSGGVTLRNVSGTEGSRPVKWCNGTAPSSH